ncbi:flagellin N-terminal helical domain-containing protein [Rhizobium halophilum]|uniref:flagellin N-terminal helical domain-containing protein n=1 Tax=Rhizobium halophilum TaxID=2846852 RepID=UPI001EFCF6C6|nr:flagellin [Rhizobium halophilum]MCF6369551.1 flagellar hook associated protein [Rhizobium halophilum]
MTSILTNTAAMSALQTLRSIGSSMEETQARVSSGLRVGGASDNAAYWSIATTMRSDNMALSAVQDALGLGAAKVDTAYAGMESAIEVVKEIKAKLVAATEDGVDKAKVQEEITQLQDQLKGITQSASFSGENWLQADLSGGAITKDVVASFVRNDSGLVSVKKVNYTLDGTTVLFDSAAADKAGILDKVATNGTSTAALTEVKVIKEVISTKTADDLIAEGATYNATGMNIDGAGTDYMATFTVGGETYIRKYDNTGAIQTDANGKELWARVVALDAVADADLIAKSETAYQTTGATFTDGADTYYYAEDQVTVTANVTGLTKDAILSVTGASVSGRVATVGTDTYIQLEEGKDVWVKANLGNATDDLVGLDINGVNYDVDEANVTLPAALQGADLGFSVSDLDITNLAAAGALLNPTGTAAEQEAAALDFMIQYVDDALELMTSSAADLGSIAMRIDLQSEFVSKLSESIDSGIGRLVDADLNEESTRLKALQTQQQLAIQSLSIANSSSEVILSLFR